MKNLTLTLVLLITSFQLMAQTDQNNPNELITIPRHMLSEQQVLQSQNASNIAAAGQYAGLGKEIGVAVSESLSAVTDETAKFAETDVGKVTMAVVVWKVLGEDILGAFVGIPFMVFSLLVITVSYFKTCRVRRVLVSNVKGEKVYELINKPVEHDDIEMYNWRMFIHAICAVGVCIISAMFMFA